jgi:hypothetical protein
MRKIEPISLWVNGQQKVANIIDLKIVNDNLKDNAVFYYQLMSEITQEDGNTFNESLVQGNITISGQDYIDWGVQTDVNQWAYEWCTTQLNLVLTIEPPSEKARIDDGPIVNGEDVESF